MLQYPVGTLAAHIMLFNRRDAKREQFQRMADSAYPALFGTALRLTRDKEDADDLTQEALVRAYEAFDRFDGENFKAWILRIATNLYINRYRQRRRQGKTASLDDEESSYEPIDAPENAPDRLLFDEMLGSEIEEALAKVPEIFRICVILSDLEGLSYDEVATAVDIPVGTVRSRIARGRAALRKELERYAKEQGYIE